ncbi:MAG TPA: tetratricopeptide repeat protein, partial [Sphingomonas sp.]|nr:tetratricopeptide repeat protein [Sphingomonas sp.]
MTAGYPMLHKQRRRAASLRPTSRTLALALLAILILAALYALTRGSPPPDPPGLIAEARKALAAGHYSAARQKAQAAVTAAPRAAAAHVLLARADLMLDDGLAAEAELDRAARLGAPAAALHTLRANALLLQGDTDGASGEVARASPRSVSAARVRARVLAARGDPAAADRALTAIVAAVPTDGAAWTDLARLRLTAGDVAGAAQAGARAVASARHDPAALTLGGEIVRLRFGLVAALPWFRAALARDPAYHPALIEYAASLGDLGRGAAMLAATRYAMAARPGSPQALYLQAVMAARAGRLDLARRLLQRTGGAIDGMPGVMLLSGSLDFARGDYDQATVTWRRLVAAQPRNLAARRLLGTAILRAGDPQGALDTLAPIVARADADSYTLRIAARASERTGDRPTAATLLDRAA